jgi:hypothetical protein
MKKPRPSLQDSDAQNTLLGDLESIRSLLEAPDALPVEEDGNDVPTLEDMVEGAFVVNESVLTSRSSFDDDDTGGTSGLADDTIKALLGDEWRVAARQILADASSTVEGAGAAWSPQQTAALNESLKMRIEHAVDDWLVDTMHTKIEDLRSRLLAVLEQELHQFTHVLTHTDDHG